MTIKQQGGIFGRNPTFNDLTVDGNLTTSGTISVPADSISGDAINGGTATPSGLAVDTSTLVVDGVNNRVGIGTTSPLTLLHATLPSGVNGDIVSLGRSANSYQFKLGMTSASMLYVGDNSSNILLGFPYNGGITFNGDTAAANALDDYEEGVWSPDLRDGAGGSVFASQANDGVYVKCGSMVWASAALFGASTSSSTDIVTINLPFAASSSKTNAAAPMVYSVGLGSAVAAYVQDGGSYLKFTKTIGSIGSNVLCNEVTTGLRGYFSIVYSTV